MSFSSLVVCDELESLNLLCRALDEARVQREICTDAKEGRKLLSEKKFEAVILDCDDMEGGGEVLKKLRHTELNRLTIVFAIVNGKTRVSGAFELGANFVMDKPLIPELLTRSLRAAQGFMLREQRRSYRHPVDMLVTVTLGKSELHFNAQDLSQGGMCLEGVKSLKTGDHVTLSFHLSEMKLKVEAAAEVAWTSGEGRAGFKFISVPRKTGQKLKQWLGIQHQKHIPLLFIDASRKPH